jgi:hypothetical protein
VKLAEFWGIASEYFNESEMLFGEMAGFKMNTELVNKYFKLVIPDPVPKPGQEPEEVNTTRQENIREELVEIYETSEAIANTSAYGNMYGAINAVTEWIDHHKEIKGGDEDRFVSLLVNNNSAASMQRNRAFKLAMDFMNN